jgi:hypothetical protein
MHIHNIHIHTHLCTHTHRYLEKIGGAGFQSLTVFRVIRLARVFRLFKTSRYSSYMQIMGAALVKSGDAFGLLLFFIGIAVVIFSSLMYYVERGAENEQGVFIREEDGRPTPFDSIPATFYWCIVTMTTVGYGDVVPLTPWGKLIACVAMICGILIIALPITILGQNFTEVCVFVCVRERVCVCMCESVYMPQISLHMFFIYTLLLLHTHSLTNTHTRAQVYTTYKNPNKKKTAAKRGHNDNKENAEIREHIAAIKVHRVALTKTLTHIRNVLQTRAAGVRNVIHICVCGCVCFILAHIYLFALPHSSIHTHTYTTQCTHALLRRRHRTRQSSSRCGVQSTLW